jgi:hypothetical protein
MLSFRFLLAVLCLLVLAQPMLALPMPDLGDKIIAEIKADAAKAKAEVANAKAKLEAKQQAAKANAINAKLNANVNADAVQ